jgi:uncharacterized DUF497 family protein
MQTDNENKGVMAMMFNTTFNYISVISLRSVLLVAETRENHLYAIFSWQEHNWKILFIM